VGHSDCHLHSRSSSPRAFLVCHIAGHSVAHRYSRRTAGEEVGSSHKVAEVVEVADSRSHLVEEADRSLAEGGSSLAGVGTAEGVVLRILRGNQNLGNPTYLVAVGCYGGEIREVIYFLSA
jgi:hypothetical protein